MSAQSLSDHTLFKLSAAEGDASLGQIIRRNLACHVVTYKYLDEILANLARDVRQDYL